MRATSPKTSRIQRTIGRLAAVTIVLAISLFSYWRINLYFQVKHQIVAIRSANLPTSGAELNDWLPEPEPSANGALALTRAFTNLHEFAATKSHTFSDIFDLKRNQEWSPEARALAVAHIQNHRAAMAQIEAALNAPEFRYPVDYSYGAAALLPHLRSVKSAAQTLRLETMLLAIDGKPDWTNSLSFQLKLADTLNHEPTSIGLLVRAAIIRIAARGAEYAFNHCSVDAEAYRRLQQEFLRTAQTNTLPIALIGERALSLPYFRMTKEELDALSSDNRIDGNDESSAQIRPSGAGYPRLMLTGFFERDLNFYLATMKKGISLSQEPWPDRLALTNVFDVGTITRRRFYIYSGMFIPALRKIVVIQAQAGAAAKLAATAFAIEAFRHSRKQLPSTLAELTPDFLNSIPIDPFDAKPIRYRRLERGYVLYSIDADGKDDGGKEPPEKKKFKDPNTYDLTFTVER